MTRATEMLARRSEAANIVHGAVEELPYQVAMEVLNSVAHAMSLDQKQAEKEAIEPPPDPAQEPPKR